MVAAVFASTNDGAAHVVGWGLLEILSLEPGHTDKPQPTKLAALQQPYNWNDSEQRGPQAPQPHP